MAALIDSENFEMPTEVDGRPLFRAKIWVTHDYEDKTYPPCQAEVSISVPPSMRCLRWDGSEVGYDSCGLLYVSIDALTDEYIEDYWHGAEFLDEAKFLRNTLQNSIDKLNAFIDREELEINKLVEANNGA